MDLPPPGDRFEDEFDSVRVVCGPGKLRRVGELSADTGARHVLLVTDAGLRAAGHADAGERYLREAGLTVTAFEDVAENPTTEHVARGVETARQAGIDAIVALGGGSAMDCAKGINVLLSNGGRMEDYQGYGKAPRPMLPAVGVPTTAGTGSEGQSYALISRADTHVKMACGDPKLKFRAVVLDPDLLESVPSRVAAVTGLDAVAHAVESYVTRERTPLSQRLAAEAWRRLDNGFETYLADRGNVAARHAMQTGAWLAGRAIEHSMLGAAHACANPLTARFGVTHGAAVGLMLPGVVAYNAAEVGALYETLCPGDDDVPGRALAERIRALRTAAGLPGRLRDYRIPGDCLGRLAEEAAGQWTAGFNPRPVAAGDLEQLYEATY